MTDMEHALFEEIKAQLRLATAQRDAAAESERRVWRAYAMAKGAAERACGILGIVDTADDVTADIEAINGDIRTAERLAGVAVE